MRYAILSDIHANENAFRHALADAYAKGVREVICLGDVVGYGPLPNETATLARQSCAHVIAGNHDDAVTGRIDASDFIDLAGDAVRRHREVLSPDNLAWLKSLDHVYAGDGFRAAHGDFTDPQKFYYVQDESDAKANFESTDAQLMFVGHTHTPQLFLTGQSGKVYKLEPTDFVVEDGKRYIVNPGSVGYPRENNGTCLSSYAIYDSDEKSVTFQTLPFAVSSVLQRGLSPKAISKKVLAVIVLGLSAIIGAAVYFLTPKTVEVKEEIVEVREDARLVIKSDQVPLTPELRKFLPNLLLANGSSPVLLKIVFSDKNHQTLFSDSLTVKKSRTKAYAIPWGSAFAEISLLKLSPDEEPQILSYKPAFKP